MNTLTEAEHKEYQKNSLKIIALDKKTEELLLKKLSSDQSNPKILWKLGELNRKRGDLKSALEYYKNVLRLLPDAEKVKYIIDILEGKSINNFSFDGIIPSPFVKIDNFLTPSELELMWQQVDKVEGSFRTSETYKIVLNEYLEETKKWFLEKVYSLFDSLWDRLNISPFKVRKAELALFSRYSGDIATAHTDYADMDLYRDRTLSFSYCFYREPKVFTGGDFLIYDTDTKNKTMSETFTRIEPENNSIILFPSNCYHEVARISCNSQDYKDGRFSYVAFLNK